CGFGPRSCASCDCFKGMAVPAGDCRPRQTVLGKKSFDSLTFHSTSRPNRALLSVLPASSWSPPAATVFWPGLCRVIGRLRDTNKPWQGQIGLVRDWYQPLLERLSDYPASRAGDLDQLEQIAFGYASRAGTS